MYVAIRVRGSIGSKPDTKRTLETLGLKRTHTAGIYPKKTDVLVMLRDVSGYLTYGEATEETVKLLIEKKGKPMHPEDKLDASKAISALKAGKSISSVGIRNQFRLSPPRKGWERGGIKKPFTVGGALGYRGEKINDIIKRMI